MSDVPVPGPDGTRRVPADQLTSDQRQMLSQWWNRVPQVLGDQDRNAMAEFEGQSIGGVLLPTDPDLIDELGFLGELDIVDFYTEPEAQV